MMDRRVTFFDGKTADIALKGRVDAEHYQTPVIHSVVTPDANILRTPNGPRERQIMFGAEVAVLNTQSGWAFAMSDGYVGYINMDNLGPATTPTHWMTALCGHAYAEPNFKSPDQFWFPFRSKFQVVSETEKFLETNLGFIPKQQIAPMEFRLTDPAAAALMFLGTPYLWGGNSPSGIDCSGLAHAALSSCGVPCLGDADLQETQFSGPTPRSLGRNQLMFWKGHVALTLDETRLIHANVNAMSVSIEGINDAISRIAKAGDGPVTSHVKI